MSAPSNLQITLLLAAVSIAGIIGMLLLDGVADLLLLLLAVMPLLFGAQRLWRHRARMPG